jgi:hypothetical protein
MADYYPLIARAIAGLDPSAPGESRRALYERARTALTNQLRGVQPPLGESEISGETLALEKAVRRVESEAAQRARDAAREAPLQEALFRQLNSKAAYPTEDALSAIQEALNIGNPLRARSVPVHLARPPKPGIASTRLRQMADGFRSDSDQQVEERQ